MRYILNIVSSFDLTLFPVNCFSALESISDIVRVNNCAIYGLAKRLLSLSWPLGNMCLISGPSLSILLPNSMSYEQLCFVLFFYLLTDLFRPVGACAKKRRVGYTENS
jgi:hypothetical protein